MIKLFRQAGPRPVLCPVCRADVELIEYPLPLTSSQGEPPPIKKMRTAPQGIMPGATSGDAKAFLQAMGEAEDADVADAARQALDAILNDASDASDLFSVGDDLDGDDAADDVDGLPPLALAAWSGQLGEVQAILDGADAGFDVNVGGAGGGRGGYTALIVAAERGHAEHTGRRSYTVTR
jgi:hypothetical protein